MFVFFFLVLFVCFLCSVYVLSVGVGAKKAPGWWKKRRWVVEFSFSNVCLSTLKYAKSNAVFMQTVNHFGCINFHLVCRCFTHTRAHTYSLTRTHYALSRAAHATPPAHWAATHHPTSFPFPFFQLFSASHLPPPSFPVVYTPH